MAEQSQKVGDRIAFEREKLELSRPALARELPGVTTGNDVYRWEKGKHLPRADTMEALAKLFGIAVADLYAGVPKAAPDNGLMDSLKKSRSEATGAQVEELTDAVLAQMNEGFDRLTRELAELRQLLESEGRKRKGSRSR